MLSCYPEGMRVGLVFRDIWGDAIVSVRQDKSISRASALFWMSAVRRWRASCRTLEEQAELKKLRKVLENQRDHRSGSPFTTGDRRPCPRAAADLAALAR